MNEAEHRGEVRETFQIRGWGNNGHSSLLPSSLVLTQVIFELLRISSQSVLFKYNKIGLLVYGVPWPHSAAP